MPDVLARKILNLQRLISFIHRNPIMEFKSLFFEVDYINHVELKLRLEVDGKVDVNWLY